MSIDDLPLPLVNFLNVIGVPWPYVDEDAVSRLATLTRQFARAVETTHDEATVTIRNIANAYQGSATDAMASGWAKLAARHVDEIVDGCQVLAGALDVAAGYIVAQKAEAIGVLIGMAAAFVADQAAAIATAGIAEAAVPLIVEGAERVMKSLVLNIEQHVVGQVVEAAAKPLFAKISDALAGLDWSRSGAEAQPATGVSIDQAAVATHIATLREQADAIHRHGIRFRQSVAGLAF